MFCVVKKGNALAHASHCCRCLIVGFLSYRFMCIIIRKKKLQGRHRGGAAEVHPGSSLGGLSGRVLLALTGAGGQAFRTIPPATNQHHSLLSYAGE